MDGEWLLLTNLAFSTTHRRQSDEIDIVAIGPPGVRVIEVKHWNAAWVKRNADLVEREAERVTDKARKVGTTLRRKVESLGKVYGGTSKNASWVVRDDRIGNSLACQQENESASQGDSPLSADPCAPLALNSPSPDLASEPSAACCKRDS